jgi:hypothetical protein
MLDRHALASFTLRADRQLLRSTPPIWPLPAFEGRSPVVVDTIDHGLGVDLAYERLDDHDQIEKYPAGGPAGTVRHFMPGSWPALAISDGTVTYAGRQKYGHAILIDHRNGWASYYANVTHLFTAPTEGRAARRPRLVRGGQLLGLVGAPYPTAMRCLHFEIWRVDRDGFVGRVNPRRYLYHWQVTQWADEQKPPADERPPPTSEPPTAGDPLADLESIATSSS